MTGGVFCVYEGMIATLRLAKLNKIAYVSVHEWTHANMWYSECHLFE